MYYEYHLNLLAKTQAGPHYSYTQKIRNINYIFFSHKNSHIITCMY